MRAAYVFAQISAPDPRAVIDGIRAIDGVQQAHNVLGPIDCVAFIEAPDMDSLYGLIGAIRLVQGVDSTDTRLVAY